MATKKFKSNVSIEEKLLLPKETSERVLVVNEDGEIESSPVTEEELEHLSGIEDNVQDQIDGKVSKSGDTMTGSLKIEDQGNSEFIQVSNAAEDHGIYLTKNQVGGWDDNLEIAFNLRNNGTFQMGDYNGDTTVEIKSNGTDAYISLRDGSNNAILPTQPHHIMVKKYLDDQLGVADGIATLDSNGKVPSSQLPSYVDDVLEFANLAAFPAEGETGKIYVALDTEKIYRWSGTLYIEISPSEVNSVNDKTGFVELDSTDLEHTQAEPSDWTVADESSIAVHLDSLAARTKVLEDTPSVFPGDIAPSEFDFVNDQDTPADITGLSFDNLEVRSFVADITIERDDSAEAYVMQGVNINGSFSISQESIGDEVGVTLSITSAGQMQYTSSDATVGGKIRFRARALTFA
jgi:hypothetical protein